jgi:hypothetical protein
MVTVRLHDQDGDPEIGASVKAKLMTPERYNGYIVPEEYTGQTDETGCCTIALFPNELGTEGSEYRFKMMPRNGKAITVYASIPNKNCFLEEICDLEPYPVRGAGAIITSEVLAASKAACAAARTATEEAASISVHIKDAVDSAVIAKQACEIAVVNAELSTTKAGIASTKAEESKSWADMAYDHAQSFRVRVVESLDDITEASPDGIYYVKTYSQ